MKCPVCKKPALKEFKPFCSERCKLVDLNKWFSGSYNVPAIETDDLPKENPANSEE